MPAGLQTFDENGVLVCDITTRLSRIVGEVFAAAGSSGSVTVDSSFGTPWALPFPTEFPSSAGPLISISGNTISWAPSTSNATLQRAADIVYGVY